MIPCEYCHQMVPFQNYTIHVLRCEIMHRLLPDDDYEDNEVSRYIHSGNQVHRVNIRDFLIEHNTPPSRSRSRRQTHTYEDNLDLSERIGNVEIGVSSIDEVSTTVLGSTQDDVETCTICLDKLNQSLYVRRLLCCHKYCSPCIEVWLKSHKTCPICKFELEPTS